MKGQVVEEAQVLFQRQFLHIQITSFRFYLFFKTLSLNPPRLCDEFGKGGEKTFKGFLSNNETLALCVDANAALVPNQYGATDNFVSVFGYYPQTPIERREAICCIVKSESNKIF